MITSFIRNLILVAVILGATAVLMAPVFGAAIVTAHFFGEGWGIFAGAVAFFFVVAGVFTWADRL